MFLVKSIIALAAIWLFIKVSNAYESRKRLTLKFDELPGATYFNPMLDMIYLMVVHALSIKKAKTSGFVMLYELAMSQCRVFQEVGLFRWYLGLKPVVIMFSPENIESIMQSTTVLDKADEYRVFEPWLGEGLVTSKRTKWQFRRKLLTPAFHFRILNDFLPIMNQEATKLALKLNNAKYACSFNVAPVIALCTLDTICETAMGVNINCQANEHSEYVKALQEVAEMSLARVCRPWLWPDWSFYSTSIGHRFAKAKRVLHDFTCGVILNRKLEWERMLVAAAGEKKQFEKGADALKGRTGLQSNQTVIQATNGRVTFDDLMTSSSFKKATKQLAFLDLLMHQHLIENNLTLDDIREEVDTFMFAGHDTTAMNISWALYLLGLHPDIQQRVRDELDQVFGRCEFSQVTGYDERVHLSEKLLLDDISVEQLAQMKYLDMVIKETLRMFPSIPFVARHMTEDVLVGGKYLIPTGSTCTIFTHALHNNAKVFPKPEVFNPDRFLPENVAERHPFSFIPFSAGARNCIGQKFAKLEVKIILAKIIRNYCIKSMVQRDRLKIVGEMVLRSTEGLPIKLTPRVADGKL